MSNTRFGFRAVIVLFFTAIIIAAVAAYAEEPPIVKAIEFRGLKRLQAESLRQKISHEEGKPLNLDKISEDIKALYSIGRFEDVRAESEPFEGGVKLIFILKEKPVITRIDLRGNKEIDDEKLKEAMTLKPGSSADIVEITENANKIYSLYEKDGYTLAQVVPVIRRLDAESVFLTYQIKEGEKVKIRKIIIKGNKEVSTGDIKDAMKTSEWWFYSYLTSYFTGGGRYERAKINADVENIRQLYLDRGYIKAEVSSPRTEISEDKQWMDITIEIKEGEQFRVSSFEFSGNTVFTEAQLRKKLTLKPGDILSMKTLREDISAMTDMYTERGYAVAHIYPDFEPSEKEGELKVVLKISEGEIYSIGRINISGNIKTREKVIRRELLLNEADTFNSKLLRRGYQRIQNLNIFETVSIEPSLSPEQKTMDLDITVKERPTGSLSIGGGYSSVDKIIGMVDLTEGNLGGRGQYAKLRGEFSSKSTTYELSFKDPWFLDYPVSFSTSIYKTRREYVNYTKKGTGGSLGFGKRFWDYWSTGASYNFERSTIFGVKENASAVIKSQEGTRITSSISPYIARDTRDNTLDPHSGLSSSLNMTYAGIGGDNKFFKAVIDSALFYPVSKRTTFSVHLNYGYATGLYGEELPLYERFYVGGIYSVRGFDYGEAGPKDETGAVTGGKRKIVFNAEYTFPLISEAGLKGVIFYDAGTAYDHSSDIRIRQSAGAGIRWLSPIGPLRLEWGYKLDREKGESKSKWEFTFGTFF